MIKGIAGKKLIQKYQSFTKETYSQVFKNEDVFLCVQRPSPDFSNGSSHLWVSDDKRYAIALQGEIYNQEYSDSSTGEPLFALLFQDFQKPGDALFARLNGAFVMFLWDGNLKKMTIVRDQIGVHQVFYTWHPDGLLFDTSLRQLKQRMESPPEIHLPALYRYLLFCYNPGEETFFKGIHRLRPAHLLRWQTGQMEIQKYWHLSFLSDASLTEADVIDQTRTYLKDAVKHRFNSEKSTGVFLSGGLDSSSVVSLLDQNQVNNLHTFSFRCKGKTFDESYYAKIVADHFKTQHHLIEYSPESVYLAGEMTALMDEPFCDVGINIATFLLAKEASTQVQEIFTGDGGDELFAGHPVYLADKMAGLIDWAPRWLFSPFLALGRQLPDSDKKNDWKVKIKRFSESYSFPKALGTHRWRAYYLLNELKKLLHPDLASTVNDAGLFTDMIAYNQEAEAGDPLGRSLYSDYQTVVQFYLRRLDLARAMGLNTKCPMLDPELVRFYGSVPSKIKKPDYSDAKHLEKAIIDPWVPHEVVYRKDKLGHSIPLKNWMRDHEGVRSFFSDWLSEERIQSQGYFNYQAIQTMMDEHQQMKRNHSHRLWALLVLMMWMEGIAD